MCGLLDCCCMTYALCVLQVKARAVALLQVWLEGYYSVDFKNNKVLLNDCVNFIQEKVQCTAAAWLLPPASAVTHEILHHVTVDCHYYVHV